MHKVSSRDSFSCFVASSKAGMNGDECISSLETLIGFVDKTRNAGCQH